MVKKVLLPGMLALIIGLMSGCFNANTEPNEPARSPIIIEGDTSLDANTVPDARVPGVNNAQDMTNANPAGNAFDWTAQAKLVQNRINMFSEIKDSRVVVADSTALVGIVFNDSYQGELTQRIRDMVAGEVMAADTGIQVVAVTADPTDVQEIFALSDNPPADMKQKVDQIARNTSTLR